MNFIYFVSISISLSLSLFSYLIFYKSLSVLQLLELLITRSFSTRVQSTLCFAFHFTAISISFFLLKFQGAVRIRRSERNCGYYFVYEGISKNVFKKQMIEAEEKQNKTKNMVKSRKSWRWRHYINIIELC